MQAQTQILIPTIANDFVKIERNNTRWVDVHNRAMACAKNLKLAYIDLLRVLIEIERDQIFYQLKTTTLHEYCVQILGLPTHTAYDIIRR